MLVLNLPFKALMFLTLMRPSLVLFLVLWLKLVKDFLKVRCRLALLPFLISCLKFKIAEGQWYRYAPSYVSPAYHLLEGFPFIQEPPSGDLQERVLIRHHDYDQCFQSVQLLQWNSQVKFNV